MLQTVLTHKVLYIAPGFQRHPKRRTETRPHAANTGEQGLGFDQSC